MPDDRDDDPAGGAGPDPIPDPEWRGLDPLDWEPLRALGHRMLDDMFDHVRDLRGGPPWREMAPADRARLRLASPAAGIGPEAAYRRFRDDVLPFATGNLHPRFMGWVHGGGNPVGMLADMLAAGLNANCGGRDHAPVAVERDVLRWCAGWFGLPDGAGGILVTGTSIANFVGVVAARRRALGDAARRTGGAGAGLVAYAAEGAHGCVAQAVEMAGLGGDNLRQIPVDGAHRLRPDALAARVAADRAAGLAPFLVVATVGSVAMGAIDPLPELAAFCRAEGLWLHVDGAFGAMLALSPARRHLVAGIEHADSIAFDFHKWPQVPYDCGCLAVRRESDLTDAFAQDLAYLRRQERGLGKGYPWPCDLGPDLSRGFRALKVWMTLLAYGTDRIGAVIDHCCDVAAHMAARIAAEPDFELAAPVPLNIVCFRRRGEGADADARNAALAARVQLRGEGVPSTTTIAGRVAIRAAIVNHRTTKADADAVLDAILRADRDESPSKQR